MAAITLIQMNHTIRAFAPVAVCFNQTKPDKREHPKKQLEKIRYGLPVSLPSLLPDTLSYSMVLKWTQQVRIWLARLPDSMSIISSSFSTFLEKKKSSRVVPASLTNYQQDNIMAGC